MIQAFVGAGGKTGLIKKYTKEYLNQGKKVLVLTSTHMLIEEDTLLTDDAGEIAKALEEKSYAMAGVPIGEKIKALSMETYYEVCKHADVVLIEADGSKHLPLKYPADYEPVIYDNVDEIIVVCGMHALGKRMGEVCHRPELVQACLGIREDTLIQPAHIQKLVQKGYVEPLKEKFPNAKMKIEPQGATNLYEKVIASLLQADMDVSLVKEEWFRGQPKLVICGGGHVSAELVKMAANLDFYIKVIDDRAEFASKERFPQADEVICDSFEYLGKYLEPNAYYCVVTRGHKDDFLCVEKILSTNYQYLGMIGSKTKVANTFAKLKEAGVAEAKIDSIFAPIGLEIGAITPAEIAVSILAQMIQEKNSRYVSSASKELLKTKESGVLCIIIEKTGSSPRGVGSMMFINEEREVDSIGGGAVEFAVMEDAKQCAAPTIKEYDLNREDSADLGMICGGSNKILFVPV